MGNVVKEFALGLGTFGTVLLVFAIFVGIVAGAVVLIPILIALFLPVLLVGILGVLVIAIIGCLWYLGHLIGVNGKN